MADQSLEGKKIAVVLESQFIPGEIDVYRQRFASYGATVELVSRLWGAPSQRFYSTVEPDEHGNVPPIQWLDVSGDIEKVDPGDYAAIIVAANYTSVRLRWIGDVALDASNAAELARSTPAARFFRRAMENPKIIKGAPCHALWLLTPSPEVLAGRKVICNQVVLADVLNTGAIYTPVPAGTPTAQQVVVDRDLVTNTSWHASEALVDKIRDLILNPPTPAQSAGE